MSFYSYKNANPACCPGSISGNALDGLQEKVCVQVKRVYKVLHPNGLSLAVDNIAKESPTFEELGTVANWSLKFNPKNVKMGLIKSNG